MYPSPTTCPLPSPRSGQYWCVFLKDSNCLFQGEPPHPSLFYHQIVNQVHFRRSCLSLRKKKSLQSLENHQRFAEAIVSCLLCTVTVRIQGRGSSCSMSYQHCFSGAIDWAMGFIMNSKYLYFPFQSDPDQGLWETCRQCSSWKKWFRLQAQLCHLLSVSPWDVYVTTLDLSCRCNRKGPSSQSGCENERIEYMEGIWSNPSKY